MKKVSKVSGYAGHEPGGYGLVSGQGRVPEEVLHHRVLEWGIATLINSLGSIPGLGNSTYKSLWQEIKYSAFTKSNSL